MTHICFCTSVHRRHPGTTFLHALSTKKSALPPLTSDPSWTTDGLVVSSLCSETSSKHAECLVDGGAFQIHVPNEVMSDICVCFFGSGVLRSRKDAVAGWRSAGVFWEIQWVPANRLCTIVSNFFYTPLSFVWKSVDVLTYDGCDFFHLSLKAYDFVITADNWFNFGINRTWRRAEFIHSF